MPLTTLFIFLSVALFASRAEAEEAPRLKIDWIQSNSTSAEALYATRTAYSREAAKAAYIYSNLIGEWSQYENEPGPHRQDELDRRLQLRYDQAKQVVDNTSYRNGYIEALTLDTIDVLKGAAKEAYGVDLPTHLVSKLAGDGLDALGRVGLDPSMSFESISTINGTMLGELSSNSPLAKYDQLIVGSYFPDINLHMSLDSNPTVFQTRIASANSTALSKIDGQLANLEKDLSGGSRKLDDLQIVAARSATASAATLKVLMDGKHAEELKQLLENSRGEIEGTYGVLSGLAQMAGDNDSAAALAKAGQFQVKLFDVLNSSHSFEDNPAAFANGYVALAQMGMSMVSQPKPDPKWQALFSELTEIRKEIVALGERMDGRFDRMERTLHGFVHEATQRLQQVQTYAVENDANIRYLQNVLNEMRRDSYGSYVLTAGLEWLSVQDDCLQQEAKSGFFSFRSSFSESSFASCRDKIALFALNGPPLRLHKAVDFDRNILASLIAELSLELPSDRPASRLIPDPSSWLAATRAFLRLGEVHPRFKGRLADFAKDPDSNPDLTLNAVISVGKFYRDLMGRMALVKDGDHLALRRDLINKVLGQYVSNVEEVLKVSSQLSNKQLDGMPNPNVDLATQQPPLDPLLYAPVTTDQLTFCDKEGRIQLQGVRMNGQVVRSPSETDQYTYFDPKYFKMPGEALYYLDHSIGFAMASGYRRPENADLSLRLCFESIVIDPLGQRIAGQIVYDMHVTYVVRMYASYLFEGSRKDLLVTRWTLNQSAQGTPYNMDRGVGRLAQLWNGISPFVPGNSIAKTIGNDIGGKVPDAQAAPGLTEFQNDFRKELDRIKSRISSGMDGRDLVAFDSGTRNARSELSFILERGLNNNNNAVGRLLAFVAEPLNLPDASEWARVQWEQGLSIGEMEAELTKRTDRLDSLLDAVQREDNLEPGLDLFVRRLDELGALRSSSDLTKSGSWWRWIGRLGR